MARNSGGARGSLLPDLSAASMWLVWRRARARVPARGTGDCSSGGHNCVVSRGGQHLPCPLACSERVPKAGLSVFRRSQGGGARWFIEARSRAVCGKGAWALVCLIEQNSLSSLSLAGQDAQLHLEQDSTLTAS